VIQLPEDPTTDQLQSLLKGLYATLSEQQRQLVEKDAIIQTQENKLQTQESQLQALQHQLEQLKRHLFGQTRERFVDPNQLKLPFGEDNAVKAQLAQELEQKRVEVKKRVYTKPHPGRAPLPSNLPVEEEHIYPACDLTDMVEIRTESTDVVEIKPAQLYIRRIIRHIFAHTHDQTVHTPALPERINPKSIAGTSVLATLLVDKFVDHLPIHRQLQRFNRLGWQLNANTAYGWMQDPMELLELLWQRQWSLMLASGYLMMDETPVNSLESDQKGKSHRGYFWAIHAPIDGLTLFRYDRSRSLEAARRLLLQDFKGYLQTDGYVCYDTIVKEQALIHLCCWAHVRRLFFEAQTNDRARAETALGFIGRLYTIEEQARQGQFPTDERKQVRLEKSLLVLNSFGHWLFTNKDQVLPKSAIGKAFAYTLSRWKQLSHYLLDGRLELDNNWIENKIRPVALGRKNWLFTGTDQTAQHGAMMYSFFASCKHHGVNEYDWLRFTLDHLPTWKMADIDQLLPHNFAKTQANLNM
jgi:transposase